MKRWLSAFCFLSLVACQTNEEVLSEICGDEADNNGNGLVDCEDEACQGTAFCNGKEFCGDDLDNDSNGLTDCEDDACSGTSNCFCEGTRLVFDAELPLSFEGDSAGGVFALNVQDCQLGDTRESPFTLDFVTNSINILVEPLDGVPMVLQTTDSCAGNETEVCHRNSDLVGALPLLVANVNVSGGPLSFLVGAREASRTGRFRITFSLPQ